MSWFDGTPGARAYLDAKHRESDRLLALYGRKLRAIRDLVEAARPLGRGAAPDMPSWSKTFGPLPDWAAAIEKILNS